MKYHLYWIHAPVLFFLHFSLAFTVFLCPSASLSLSYLLGRRRWRSPWPSWPEPWAAPAEWGRSSLRPHARSGTSGSEMHTLRAERWRRKAKVKTNFTVWWECREIQRAIGVREEGEERGDAVTSGEKKWMGWSREKGRRGSCTGFQTWFIG